MTEKIESKIQQLLKTGQRPDQVFVSLLGYLSKSSSPSIENQAALFNFAINAGLWKKSWSTISKMARDDQALPWPQLLQLAFENNIAINKKLGEVVGAGAKNQQLVEQLVLNHSWDQTISALADARNQVKSSRKQSFARKRSELLDQLSYFRNNLMHDQEGELLASLNIAFPEDPEIKNANAEYSLRHAYKIISNTQFAARNRKVDTTRMGRLLKEEIEALEPWGKAAIEISAKNPSSAYDLAIGLYFVGDYNQAYQVLELAPRDLASDWFRAEVLVSCRRFVDALSCLSQLENKYDGYPETTFGSLYLRAICIHGLGRLSEAIELLGSLVNTRPNYRSSHSLLLEWQEEPI